MERPSSRLLVLAVAALSLGGAGQSRGATRGATQPRPQPLQVRHEPVTCFMAERYPEIDACFDPNLPVDGRVYFRAEAGRQWHSVTLRPVGSCYRGTLPRPLPESGHVVYYLSATAPGHGTVRTPEQSARVVTDEKACPGGHVGPFLSAAAVSVQGGSLPSGFIGAEGPVSHAAKKVVAIVVGAGAVGAGVALHGSHGAAGSPAAGRAAAAAGTGGPSIPASSQMRTSGEGRTAASERGGDSGRSGGGWRANGGGATGDGHGGGSASPGGSDSGSGGGLRSASSPPPPSNHDGGGSGSGSGSSGSSGDSSGGSGSSGSDGSGGSSGGSSSSDSSEPTSSGGGGGGSSGTSGDSSESSTDSGKSSDLEGGNVFPTMTNQTSGEPSSQPAG